MIVGQAANRARSTVRPRSEHWSSLDLWSERGAFIRRHLFRVHGREQGVNELTNSYGVLDHLCAKYILPVASGEPAASR